MQVIAVRLEEATGMGLFNAGRGHHRPCKLAHMVSRLYFGGIYLMLTWLTEHSGLICNFTAMFQRTKPHHKFRSGCLLQKSMPLALLYHTQMGLITTLK